MQYNNTTVLLFQSHALHSEIDTLFSRCSLFHSWKYRSQAENLRLRVNAIIQTLNAIALPFSNTLTLQARDLGYRLTVERMGQKCGNTSFCLSVVHSQLEELEQWAAIAVSDSIGGKIAG